MIQDRGHKKWTALMLPEHKERLQQWALSQEDVSQPVLDEDQLQSINEVLSISLEEQRTVEVIYYDQRRYKSIYGQVKRCDLLSGILVLEQPELGRIHIILKNIKDIRLA
ncbi:YolD-like family protein [Paenibacillus polymyxa]|uniref:YolD-like family protein n=1 Tax=Paenibacillus polymyxa TaxID=1406 RepID=UPI0025B6827C|nr:YolD-like family protein [Paenibacillus polymyxa]MDN4106088.1 YolD-like family protein [Paenibacillus polymyxa]